jgi:hypothetical protein
MNYVQKVFCVDCKRVLGKTFLWLTDGFKDAVEFEDGWRCKACAEKRTTRL